MNQSTKNNLITALSICLIASFLGIGLVAFGGNIKFLFASSADALASQEPRGFQKTDFEDRLKNNPNLDTQRIVKLLSNARQQLDAATDRAQNTTFWALASNWLSFICSALVTLLAAYSGITMNEAAPAAGEVRKKSRNARFVQLAALGALASIATGMGSRLSERAVQLRHNSESIALSLDETRLLLLETDPADAVKIEGGLSKLERTLRDAKY